MNNYENKKIHLIGIGGVSMSGIAYMLKDLNAIVTGTDANESALTRKLKENNIEVIIGTSDELIKNADIVIYTAAIKENNPDMISAKKYNKELYERAKFLGILSKMYKNCLCISGTHGKSTTTGIVSNIFLEANLNPTISIGANLPIINSNIHIGTKDYLIMESCEYVDSFLNFFPTGAIITNIDNDHLDYFKNLDNIKKSFKKYSELLPENGFLIVNLDDDNSKELLNTNTNVITYGINKDANYNAKDIKFNNEGYARYKLYINNEYIKDIELSIPGIHNVYNSLSAIALSYNYIKDLNTISTGIKKYTGVGRRFEFIGKYNNANLYDDYAHHPTEIYSTLDTVKKMKYNNCYAIFQGHTYSRTKEHLEDFAKVLKEFDNIVIAPIYAAREENIYNVNETDLVDLIKKDNKNVIYIDSFDKITNHLKETIKENDLVITIGAGPINEVVKNLI